LAAARAENAYMDSASPPKMSFSPLAAVIS